MGQRGDSPAGKTGAGTRASQTEFGRLLQQYRCRMHLSQRQLAVHLGIDESMVAKVELGTRKAPRMVEFWERLPSLPGMTEEMLTSFRLAANRVMVAPKEVPVVMMTEVDNCSVAVQVLPHVGHLTEDEAEVLAQQILLDATLVVRDFVKRKESRQG